MQDDNVFGSLGQSGWTKSDLQQELDDIQEALNGKNIHDADRFDKELMNRALSSCIGIYLSTDDKELKANAFKRAEMVEFLNTGFCGYARLRIEDAIQEQTEEDFNTPFVLSVRNYFTQKFSEYGFVGLRQNQTFNSKECNTVFSHELKIHAFDDHPKAIQFLVFACSFLNSPYDFIDAAETAINSGMYSNVETYFDFLTHENYCDDLNKLLRSKDVSFDFFRMNDEIRDLLS